MSDNRRPFGLILILTGLAVWVFALIVFWFFISGSDALGYSVVFFVIIFPVTIFVISLLTGSNGSWGKRKWLSAAVWGVMYMLAEYATFNAANMAAFGKFNMPRFEMIPVGAIISVLGLAAGTAVKYLMRRNRQNT